MGAAKELKEAFGENPPAEAAQEIRQHTRRGCLKAALAAATLIATPIGIKLHKIRETARRKKIETAIVKSLWECFQPKNLDHIPAERQVEEDGSFSPWTANKSPELGLNFGFATNKVRVAIPGKEKVIEVVIDKENTTMQPLIEDMTPHPSLKPFTLAQNVHVGANYIHKNKIRAFRINIPYTYTDNGESHVSTHSLNFNINGPTEAEEKEIDQSLRAQIEPADSKQLDPEVLKNLKTIIDKNGEAIIPTTITTGPNLPLSVEMGDGTVFLGEPKILESGTSKRPFKLHPVMSFQLLNEKEEVIKVVTFQQAILFSKDHLKKVGVKKIILYLNAILEIEGKATSRGITFEYSTEDFAKLDKEIPIDLPNGNRIILKP